VRVKGRRGLPSPGGEEDGIAVEEVGTGVGYVTTSDMASRDRFRTRGSAGEDEKGSKAGRRDAAVLFTPATGGTGVIFRLGEGAMLALQVENGHCTKW
jgi:hypothetical protein